MPSAPFSMSEKELCTCQPPHARTHTRAHHRCTGPSHSRTGHGGSGGGMDEALWGWGGGGSDWFSERQEEVGGGKDGKGVGDLVCGCGVVCACG